MVFFRANNRKFLRSSLFLITNMALHAGCDGYKLNRDLSLSAGAFSFPATVIGNTSDETLTLRNTGLSAVRFTSATISFPFIFKGGTFPGTGGTCDQPLAKSGSCTVVISYKPRWPMDFSGTVPLVLNYTQQGNTAQITANLAITAATTAGVVYDSGTCANTIATYTAGATANPGGRRGFAHCQDSSNNLYVFGGSGSGVVYNDLWKWDGTTWTKLSGTRSTSGPVTTVYGAGGSPGYSMYGNCAVNSSGHLYLFGGQGYDQGTTDTSLDTLWRWDGSSWTQLWGTTTNIASVPGTQGEVSYTGTVQPGARQFAHMWFDKSDRLHLFGGYSYIPAGHAQAYMADMFYWTGSGWAYETGSQVANQTGNNCGGAACGLSSAGQTGSNYFPEGRWGGIHGVDSSGTFWFGMGEGAGGRKEDLWKYDGTQWTYVYGPNTAATSAWGTLGVSSSSNRVGARRPTTGGSNMAFVFDPIYGRPWFFGGATNQNLGSGNTPYYMADLWTFFISGNIGTPVWMLGQVVDGTGILSPAPTRGAAGVTGVSVVGSRAGHATFVDRDGYPSIWGGYDVTASATCNDMWRL